MAVSSNATTAAACRRASGRTGYYAQVSRRSPPIRPASRSSFGWWALLGHADDAPLDQE